MKYKGRLKSVEEFENMVIRSQKDGSVLRVKDIAEVELGRESYSFHGEADGVPGVTFMVFQVAGANATAVNQESPTCWMIFQKIFRRERSLFR